MQTKLFFGYEEMNTFISDNKQKMECIDSKKIGFDWINDLFNQGSSCVRRNNEWMGFVSEYPIMARAHKNNIIFISLHDIYAGTLCSVIQKRLQDENDNKNLAAIHLFSDHVKVSFFTVKNGAKKSHIRFNQYIEQKQKHPDVLPFYRCGNVYETYCDDAVEAANILGIMLAVSAQYSDKSDRPLRMAGFPHHALDTYISKLIRAGKRVAILDPITESK